MTPSEQPPPTPSALARTMSVARRELAGYFATPLAAVFLVTFVALAALLAFQAGGLFTRGTADLRALFQWQPWLGLFFMPALGMRLWADERRSGSLELLMTLPLSPRDMVLGKFLAAWAFACVSLLLTVPLWITIAWLGAPDQGVIVAGYIASALLFASLLSVCACLSACTRNAVVAFVLGVTACFVLLLSGYPLVLDFFAGWAPRTLIEAVASMSALVHFEALTRGVLDVRDLLYPLSVVVGGLMINAILLRGPDRAVGTRWWSSGRRLIALIVAGVVLFNAAAGYGLVGWRIDLTHEGLYTFSPGTRAILASLREPVRLDYYCSSEALADVPEMRAHAQRVQEYLDELVTLSDGSLELRVIHPKSFSGSEDDARAAGLIVHQLNAAGATAILGLVAAGPTGQTKSIPLFTPERDAFLEYEITRAIATVGRTRKPTVGLLSCMPLEPQRQTMDGSLAPPSRAPLVVEQMRELFNLVEIPPDADALPDGIEALAVVQPRTLSEGMLRSIDAWAVAGKPLVVLADPFAESDTHPDSRAMGTKVPATTYDFPLLAAWGIDIPRDFAVGDINYTTRIQTAGPSGAMRELNYVAWLSLTRNALSQQDPLMGGFEAINLKSVGEIRRRMDAPAEVCPTIEPLIVSSDGSQLIQTIKLGYFGDAEQLLRDCKPDGIVRTFAARIKGPIKSAFTEKIGIGDIVVIADVDLLWDDTWVSTNPQTGQHTAIADNGPLIIGLLERMAGDPAVASLRSRGGFRRPFERVEELRKAAETRYIAREKDLQWEVRTAEVNIAQLQSQAGGTESGKLLLSEDQKAELARLQQTVNEYRKELRSVQFGLREDVETLGQRLLFLNVVVWPAIVAVGAGLWCWRASRRVDHIRPEER